MPRRVLNSESFSGKEKKRHRFVVVLYCQTVVQKGIGKLCVSTYVCLTTKTKYELSIAEEFYPVKLL